MYVCAYLLQYTISMYSVHIHTYYLLCTYVYIMYIRMYVSKYVRMYVCLYFHTYSHICIAHNGTPLVNIHSKLR